MSVTKTNASEVQVSQEEIDNLLGMPGAEVANMAPNSDNPDADDADPNKPTFFQKEKVNMDFLDPEKAKNPTPNPTANPEEEEEEEEEDDDKKGAFSDLVPDPSEEEEAAKKAKAGRPSLDKGGMAQLAQALIDDKVILPFDEDKPLTDYTMDDFKELFALNFQEKERAVKEATPKEFFESLPTELQYAAQYVANGGTDMKGLFKALASAEEAKSLDPTTERGQEMIVREYLRANNFGTDEEIQEEIDSWKDLEKLEAKAQQFKPKLDKMQEQRVQRQIQDQEAKKKKQEEASLNYANSIYDTLAKGELNGLKIDNKVQNMLYQGLIRPNYPSVSGSPTNLFGHLIEKHQFVEPNHGLIAEALWLLADPDGYRAEIQKGAKNDAAAEAARQLKIEQAQKNSGGGNEPEANDRMKGDGGQRTIKRPDTNFFKR